MPGPTGRSPRIWATAGGSTPAMPAGPSGRSQVIRARTASTTWTFPPGPSGVSRMIRIPGGESFVPPIALLGWADLTTATAQAGHRLMWTTGAIPDRFLFQYDENGDPYQMTFGHWRRWLSDGPSWDEDNRVPGVYYERPHEITWSTDYPPANPVDDPASDVPYTSFGGFDYTVTYTDPVETVQLVVPEGVDEWTDGIALYLQVEGYYGYGTEEYPPAASRTCSLLIDDVVVASRTDILNEEPPAALQSSDPYIVVAHGGTGGEQGVLLQWLFALKWTPDMDSWESCPLVAGAVIDVEMPPVVAEQILNWSFQWSAALERVVPEEP